MFVAIIASRTACFEDFGWFLKRRLSRKLIKLIKGDYFRLWRFKFQLPPPPPVESSIKRRRATSCRLHAFTFLCVYWGARRADAIILRQWRGQGPRGNYRKRTAITAGRNTSECTLWLQFTLSGLGGGGSRRERDCLWICRLSFAERIFHGFFFVRFENVLWRSGF